MKSLRGLEILEESPRISEDTRFLKEYFLPGYARRRKEPPRDRAAAFAFRARVLRGLIREDEGDFSGAQEDYSRAAAINPRCPGLYTLRSGVRFRRGDRKGAVEDAHRAIDLHPENLDAFVRLAHLFQGQNPRAPGIVLDFAEAAKKILIEDPKCAWAYALRAEAVGRRRSSSDARKSLLDLKRADQLDPKRAWIKAFLGRALSAGDKPAGLRRGLKLFSAAARLSPRSGWIFSWRAQILVKLGKNRAALSDLDKGLRLDPEYRLAYAWRAELREKLGDDGGAIADLTRCLAVLPRPTFYHRRAVIQWRSSDVLGALEDLTRCVGLTPQFNLAYGGFEFLVSVFDNAGREWRLVRKDVLLKARPFLRDRTKIEAVPRCDQGPASLFLRLDPSKLLAAAEAHAGSALAHAWLGRSYLNAGEFPSALVFLEKALALDPQCFAALAWRGEAYCRMGDYASALADLDLASAHKPLFFSTLLWRGAARAGCGDYEKAIRDWLAACGKDPGKANLVFWWIRWNLPRAAFYLKESGEAVLSAVELALLAGKPVQALRLLRSKAVPESQKARAYALRAKAKRLTGDLEGALRDAACAKLGVGA